MKNNRLISLLCAIAIMLTWVLPVSAVDANDCSDNLINEVESFLAEAVYSFDDVYALPSLDDITLGQMIPSYASTNDSMALTPTVAKFYPVIADSSVIGLLQVCEYSNGEIALSYMENYSNEINQFSGQNIAIISDGRLLSIVAESSNQLTSRASITYANPFSAEYSLDVVPIAERAAPTSHSLSVALKRQYGLNDCWAACVASIGQYYVPNKSYTATQVARAIGITSDNPKSMSVAQQALSAVFEVATTEPKNSLTASSIMNFIYNQSAPILAGFTYANAQVNVGHMMVIRGYATGSNYLNLLFMDPSEQGGFVTARIINSTNMSFTYQGTSWWLIEYIVKK